MLEVVLDVVNFLFVGQFIFQWFDLVEMLLGSLFIYIVISVGIYILEVVQEQDGIVCLVCDIMLVMGNFVIFIVDLGLLEFLICINDIIFIGGLIISIGFVYIYFW